MTIKERLRKVDECVMENLRAFFLFIAVASAFKILGWITREGQ